MPDQGQTITRARAKPRRNNMTTIASALQTAVADLVHWVGKLPIWFLVQTEGTKVKAQVEGDIAAEEAQVAAALDSALQGELVTLAASKAIALTDAQAAILPTIDNVAKGLINDVTSDPTQQATLLAYVNTQADSLLTTAFTTVIDSATGLATDAAKAAFKK